MKLVVGLGNIGPKYKNSRHNLGFMVLDKLILQLLIKDLKDSDDVKLYQTVAANLLAYPKLLMNNSGKVVAKLVAEYGIEMDNLLVVRDDIDLEFGKIRGPVNLTGSGGHQGVESVITSLSSNTFYQLKFGFGRPPKYQEADDFVLEKIPNKQLNQVNKAILEMTRRIKVWLNE